MVKTSNQNPSGGQTDATDLVTEKVNQGTQQAQQAVGQATDSAKQGAQSLFQRERGQATQALDTLHDALQDTSNTLRQKNESGLAGLTDKAAGGVQSVSQYLQSRDLNQLVSEAEQFARSKPQIFLGGAFGLGLLAARFLKSSTPGSSNAGSGAQYRPTSPGSASGYNYGSPSSGMPTGVYGSADVEVIDDVYTPSYETDKGAGYGTSR